MPNLENLNKRVPFQKNDERINKEGRPPGTKNRSTIARQILELTAKYPDQIFQKLKEQYPSLQKEMTIEEMMTIVQADKAIRKQDTQAYAAIFDSAYGKASQAITGADGKDLIPEKVIFQLDDRFKED